SVHFPHYCMTVSHVLQVLCRDYYRTQTIYIPNGARVQFAHTKRYLDSFGLKPKEYFLTVGRLLSVKGIHHAIEAFRDIETTRELVIVGDGDKVYLKQLQEAARGDHRIRFLGFQSGDALRELYANAYA